MRYIYDHDLHIHSELSLCSRDKEQTPEAILEYARKNRLKTVALTNHYWDESVSGPSRFYSVQGFEWISRAKPLPRCEGVDFLFGCETDMDKSFRLGLPPERYCDFDFIIIPTTHLHMKGFTISEEDSATPSGRAKAWLERLEAVLGAGLPYHKVGIAHPACNLIAPTREEYLEVLDLLPEGRLTELFSEAARLGVGIELNAWDMSFAEGEEDTVLRLFRIAKSCGCKFYLGSDAHHPDGLGRAGEYFERAIDCLGLTEEDKFRLKSR